MWMCQIRFTVFREALKDRVGATNKDSQWSFGQILCLASWVPVLVEVIYIYREGPEAALTGQLMVPYEVKERSDVGMVEIRREDEIELLS